MGTLVENAQQHVESLIKDLEGDDDFMAFMTIRGRDDDGIVYVGLPMPDGADAKDYIADVMMAMCALYRAVEVVFASTSWMVMGDAATEGVLKKYVVPSKSPDRVEAVFLHSVDADGDRFSSATVTRHDNAVSIGEWSTTAAGLVGGRFGDAIHGGMEIGRKLPPGMCAYIDAEVREGRVEGLIATWMRAMGSARDRVAADKEAARRN